MPLKYLKLGNLTSIMGEYQKIHIWEFPLDRTFIRLNDAFRKALFKKAIKRLGSEYNLIDRLNRSSLKYGLKRSHSRLSIYSWIKGGKYYKGKNKAVNVPIWALIEISKINEISSPREIERNVIYYTSRGKSNRIYKPKLPLKLTPELVSIIFNFCGDGHIADKGKVSSYKQINKEGLNNFLGRLRNIFGEFDFSKNEFKDGRLNVPKIVSDFYVHYFGLEDTGTFSARIPNQVKRMPKEFLLAGLCAFIVDEGNVTEIIEIYSKNLNLLKDIREIAMACGYKCNPIREKIARGELDSYRFNISSESYLVLYKDIIKLSQKFPKCNLAQKMNNLKIIVKRKNKKRIITKKGITKHKILELLSQKERTIFELATTLNLSHSTIREHLWKLRDAGRIISKCRKRDLLWYLNKFTQLSLSSQVF